MKVDTFRLKLLELGLHIVPFIGGFKIQKRGVILDTWLTKIDNLRTHEKRSIVKRFSFIKRIKVCKDCGCFLDNMYIARCRPCRQENIRINTEKRARSYTCVNCEDCGKSVRASTIVPHEGRKICGDCYRHSLIEVDKRDDCVEYIEQYFNMKGEGLRDISESKYQRDQRILKNGRGRQ